jgi:hypothetical protein
MTAHLSREELLRVKAMKESLNALVANQPTILAAEQPNPHEKKSGTALASPLPKTLDEFDDMMKPVAQDRANLNSSKNALEKGHKGHGHADENAEEKALTEEQREALTPSIG